MDDGPIYLDYNATTPVLPEVVDAMLPYLREHFGNPSSGHVYGRRAHAAVERARQQVAGLIGCDASDIIFTSGGTEANNLAIRGVTEARDVIDAGTVLVTVMHSKNVTGVMPPVVDLTNLAHECGAVIHTDAAQSVGKVSVNVRELGVDLLSVAASTGSACHAGEESAPGVILAMGVPVAEALGTVRLTLGRGTTAEDVSRAADALIRSWRRTQLSRP